MRSWTTVLVVMAIVGFAALMSYLQQRQALIKARRGWDLVPIVVAGEDLEEGTVLLPSMIAQRPMPSQFVTASVVKPENYSYVVGQKLVVSLKKGDPLMWVEFMCPKYCGQRDGSGVRVESTRGASATIQIDENKIKHVDFDFVHEDPAQRPDGGKPLPAAPPRPPSGIQLPDGAGSVSADAGQKSGPRFPLAAGGSTLRAEDLEPNVGLRAPVG